MKVIGLAVALFDLAFIVACVALAYRYLTQSSERLYAKALRGVLGPWADELVGSPLTADLRLRGPLQLTNILLPKMQLPMSREEFIVAFERVAPGRYGEAFAALRRHDPAREWEHFVEQLRDEQSLEAEEIIQIDKDTRRSVSGKFSDEGTTIDLSEVRAALWALFPDVDDLMGRYDDFLAKVDYANRRRNLRQLTIIAGLFAVGGNLTFARLFGLDFLPSGNSLFDTEMARTLPSLIVHREFVSALKDLAWCMLPTITLAGVADVLDRRLFGATNIDLLVAPLGKSQSRNRKEVRSGLEN